MIAIAFTLGFFGSIHCLGMCGPLAIAICCRKDATQIQQIRSGLSYNFGRIVTYALLGLAFGFIGEMFMLVSIQKAISIILGIVLVLVFMLSANLDSLIVRSGFGSKIVNWVNRFISNTISKANRYSNFRLGIANGLLPCGLVYLALTGAVTSASITQGMLFMISFGLGTLPAMLGLTTGADFLKSKFNLNVNKALSFISLAFGLFLIYRGVMINTPDELNFWEALRNPIMCH